MQEITQAWKKIKQNQHLKENFRQKAKILAAIREFFAMENFLEVDTPALVLAPDTSAFNEVFKIEGKNLFLSPSPEFFIKKLLTAGLKNVYQITKAYRDWQENDPLHLCEFTILEWYRDNATYLDLMVDCENLVNFIYHNCHSSESWNLCRPQIKSGMTTICYQDQQINLTPPWTRISCKEAFREYAKIDLDEFLDIKKAKEICRKKGYQVNPNHSWEELYHQVFLNEVESKLPKEQPLILYDYPAPLAALSKMKLRELTPVVSSPLASAERNPAEAENLRIHSPTPRRGGFLRRRIKESDPRYAERFEFYIGGLELGNGYSELTDAREQKKRLKADIEIRKQKGMKVFDYDHDLIQALKEGLPKTAGIAVGVDRLIMLFTDSFDIHEVAPFAV